MDRPTDLSVVEGEAMSARLVPAADPAELRRAYSCFPSGVAAVCADLPSGPTGLLVSSFTSVSLDPPLASICIMDTSQTWLTLAAAPRLGISFLSHTQQELCAQLSGPAERRFEALELTTTGDGSIFVPGATAWLDCTIHNSIPAGDHVIVLLRIEQLTAEPHSAPLVFHGSRFHRLSA